MILRGAERCDWFAGERAPVCSGAISCPKLSYNEAAEIWKVRLATLSDLLHGEASLRPEMALRIEKAFGPD